MLESFSALPAGGMYGYGSFYDVGNYAGFWSASEFNSYDAYYMNLNYYYEDADLGINIKGYGISVSCLQN